MTSTMTMVVCPECRHENEAERVYCHECGARLDRRAVKVRQEDVQDTRKRVKRLFDPQRDRIRSLFFKISKVVLGACAVAGLVQIALPPDVPSASKPDLVASQIRFDVEKATTHHQSAQLSYTDAQANAFLASALKVKQKSLDHPLLDFKRAIIAFHEGSCSLTIERSLFGYSLFTTLNVAPTLAAGRIVAPSKGGSIGRLPIHPQIAQFMNVLFADLWSALDHEAKLVAKMQTMEFHDKTVVLTAAP